ncbi:MAG: hypothetical protein ABSF00_03230 [Candidatus Bathyarchaeia archaeon]
MFSMRVWSILTALLMVSLLIISSSAVSPVKATAVWRDITPAAYLNPPQDPVLGAVYMFPPDSSSPEEGWAIGTIQAPTNADTSLPAIFHYDGSFWNPVPAPRIPAFPALQCPYNLNGLSFGPPNQPISKNDGWAVGQLVFIDDVHAQVITTNTECEAHNATAIHWDGVAWRPELSGLSGFEAGTLNSVFMVSPTDVWAVGQDQGGCPTCHGTVWHWTGVPGLGGGWNLVYTDPTLNSVLDSVFMVSSTEGWAVGRDGTILHYFGGTWTPFPSPFPTSVCVISCELFSVYMISPTEGWATGVRGLIIHYSQGIWSGPVSPGITTDDLFSVFMVSSGEGWATGGGILTETSATILHYTGGVWTQLPVNLLPFSPTVDFSLNSVYFTTPTDGWAVGGFGLIIHFDGSNWGSITSPTTNNFTSVNFGPPLIGPINPNDGWAVGNVSLTAPTEPTIYHWNGFAWTKGITIGVSNDLNSVFMLNGGDVWTVGGGPHSTASCPATPIALCPVILHFTGGAWNTVTPPPGTYRLKSIFMVTSTEGWAVGEQAGSTGIILHYTVTGGVGTWGIFPSASTISGLNSVFMLSPFEGWAVGDNQTILHYTVTGGVGTWNPVTVSGTPTLSGDANLTSVFMLSTTSGWAVGGIQAGSSSSAGPVILYWDGTKWTQVATPTIPGGISPTGHTSATLKSVFCSGPNDCWASGLPGKIFATLFHWDGVTWTNIPTMPALLGQVPPILTSIYMTGPDTGWIVGSAPEFPSILAQDFSVGGTAALSTMLRAAPFVVFQTATNTVTSIVTTQTTSLTGVATSVNTFFTTVTSTNTTVGPPAPGGALVPVIVAIVLTLILGLLAVFYFLTRRRPRRPVILYPIPRRP